MRYDLQSLTTAISMLLGNIRIPDWRVAYDQVLDMIVDRKFENIFLVCLPFSNGAKHISLRNLRAVRVRNYGANMCHPWCHRMLASVISYLR